MNKMELIKKWTGGVEGALGFLQTEEQARELDRLLKTVDGEAKEIGYKRVSMNSEIDISTERRQDISVISSAVVDRDRDFIVQAGLNFNEYKKNPTVLFNHNRNSLPVGKCLNVFRYNTDTLNGWKAITHYTEQPDDWEGEWLPDAVFHLIKSGVLRGKSIGFIPTKARRVTAADAEKNLALKDAQFIIEKATVFEYSVVNVGANQDALVQAVSKGLVPNEVCESLELDIKNIVHKKNELTSGDQIVDSKQLNGLAKYSEAMKKMLK